ncbi:hypothetical protein TVAG_268390 [Trichomonas vaginalis G3]|uniref:Glycosyltransferase 61 catalytic domain-containing protein n=1 Tax=Trichomonas vaginalis (strain ATCC PRA-98 / G3) TaxID=412133 RepID=A2DLI8_TRIV3|nr:glycosyltransferase family [Trichomonas vaginalis G3]EAY18806.1 hypothetical protein TVAG_268390 [Trichomonas vaginalis G3]KAI5539255.1 glycosyltransferase family [Trichomonas vaginalis G3]|eukprot:XP_001579792.1 hypothetical protein [Trichomonas vaginalis G3]
MNKMRGRRFAKVSRKILIIPVLYTFLFFVLATPTSYAGAINKRVFLSPTMFNHSGFIEDHVVEYIHYNESFKIPRKDILFVLNDGVDQVNYKLNISNQVHHANSIVATIVHLRDCYVSPSTFVATLDSLMYRPPAAWYIKSLFDFYPGKVVGSYDSVIALGHLYVYSFGHFVNDVLAPLILIPKEVRDKSYILCFTSYFLARKFLPAFGLEKRFLKLNRYQWVYANHVYVADNPRTHVSHYGPAFKNLSILFKEKYNLMDVKPDRYILSNRKGKIRRVPNFKEVVKTVKTLFPQYNWEAFIDNANSISTICKTWGRAQVLYLVTGSNVFKCFFLPQSCMVIILFGKVYDNSTLFALGSLNIHTCLVIEPQINHAVYPTTEPMSLKKTEDAFKAVIYYLEHKEWPKVDYGKVVI